MIELELSNLNAFAIIFSFSLISNGLILVNDGVYWDGWMIQGWQKRSDFVTMRTFFSQVGMPLFYYFHRFMARLPYTNLSYKILSFLSILLSSLLIYLICQMTGYLTDLESLFIVILFLCYPGQQMIVEPAVIGQYVFPQVLFYLACYLGLTSESMGGGAHWAMRVGALIFFLISFNMNALLVFYFGFISLLMFGHIHNEGFSQYGIIQYIITHMDYLFLPFIFWFWKEKYTPRSGIYTNYNRLNLNPFSHIFRLCYRRLFAEGIIGQIIESLKCFKSMSGKLVLAFLMILLAFYQFVYGGAELNIASGNSNWNAVLLFGVVILVLGTLPYALVGQVFGLQGWETKNNLLLPLPVALIIISLVNIFVMPSLRIWILAIVIVAFILRCNHNYLLLQAVWAKNESFLRKLSGINNAERTSIMGVLDLHSVKISQREHPEHPSNTLVFMFERIWGDKSRLGIQIKDLSEVPFSLSHIEKKIKEFCLDWMNLNIKTNGKQGLVIINDFKVNFSAQAIAIKYLYYRFFRPSKFDSYIDSIATVEYRALSTPISTESVKVNATNQLQEDTVTDKANGIVDSESSLSKNELKRFSVRMKAFNALGAFLSKLYRMSERSRYVHFITMRVLRSYLRLVSFLAGPIVLAKTLVDHPNDYPADVVEDSIEKSLDIVPYSSQATKILFDYMIRQKTDHNQLSIITNGKKLLIYDNIFPNLQCSFTTVEFNAYLEKFPEACVYTSGENFSAFDGPISFDAVLADYALEYPALVGRIFKINPKLNYHADLFYTLFLRNMFNMMNMVETYKIPFIFTLYSGGDFCMDDPASDAKAKRVFSSPYFRKVIVGQEPIREYILSKDMVQPEQIEFVYGPICNTDYLLENAVSKKYYKKDKPTFDICFVAYKHMPMGRDKGYDIFIQAAKLLLHLSPDFHFHVVGGFTPADIGVSDLFGHIHFYGKQPQSFFPSFYSSMDILLSPCLPFVLAPGAFDGAPNVSTIEAGLCGVAVFMTDQLKQNKIFENNKDLVVVPHDAWAISEMIEHYFRNTEALYGMAHQGREKFAGVFNRQVQIEPRIRLLESVLRE